MRWTYLLTLFTIGVPLNAVPAQQSLQSGLAPGLRPGPYSSLVCTGEKRGQLHCFVCETEDKPAVVVFARDLSDPLGKLTRKLDEALAKHKSADLRAWVTFLAKTHVELDADVVQWGRRNAISNVPLMVFEDVGGPPAYKLAKEADVTILFWVQQKVVANFAFRPGELNEQAITAVLEALPQVVEKK